VLKTFSQAAVVMKCLDNYPSELLAILSGQLLSYQKKAIAPFVFAGLKKLSLAKNFGDLPFNVSIKLKIFNTFHVEEKQFWQFSLIKNPSRKPPYKTMAEPTPHKTA
jgi:hypothetical protein